MTILFSLFCLSKKHSWSIERFETKGKISLESFLKLVVEFGWFDEMSAIMGKSKFSTGEQLETINRNRSRQKGR